MSGKPNVKQRPETTFFRSNTPVIVIFLSLVVFLIYAKTIIIHFETRGLLQDSGWFAYLFGANDLLLMNPQSINELSFYAHHMSPVIYLFSAVFSGLFGFSGISTFAIYTGTSSTLLFLALALSAFGENRDRLAFHIFVGFLFTLTNEFIFRANSYPHYEILIVGLVPLLYLALARQKYVLAYTLLAMLVLTREDGGLYAAFAALCYFVLMAGLRFSSHAGRTALVVFALGILMSLLSLLIQQIWFQGFETFSSNFSGNGFDHLSFEFIGTRLVENLKTEGILSLSIAVLMLVFFDRRYAVPTLLLMPLIVLHLVSVRDTLGLFGLHYGLPFALIGALTLMVYFDRHNRHTARRYEHFVIIILLIASSVLAGPLTFMGNGASHRFRIAVTLTPKWVIGNYQQKISERVHLDAPGTCAGITPVALNMDLFPKDRVLGAKIPPDCQMLILVNGGHDYERIVALPRFSEYSLVDSFHDLEFHQLK
jgi:hypothetical protein